METDLIIVREYCQKSHVDPSFIVSLEEDGLIDIRVVDGERYLLESQLQDLERFIRWHEDLSVNIEGIGVIHELMGRLHEMQHELDQLRREVRVFQLESFRVLGRIGAKECSYIHTSHPLGPLLVCFFAYSTATLLLLYCSSTVNTVKKLVNNRLIVTFIVK